MPQLVPEGTEPRARVLVVDDDDLCLTFLREILGDLGYEVQVAADGKTALDLICRGDYRIVLSDWQMPGMTGIELCRSVRRRQFSGYVYFILLTSLGHKENLITGLDAGADDFIAKPFDPDELRVRLRVAERIVSLESRDLIIFSLAKLAESRDPETGAHLERMREYCRVLAEELSRTSKYADVIDADYVRTIYVTSPIHDIGKVGIPDHVLLKPGRLTPEEYAIMQEHTEIGARTLELAMQGRPSAGFLQFARDIAWTHHERFDGTGYPRGLAGEEIPLCGRIVAVADVYDALTTKRVYKEAFSHERSRSIIIDGRGTAFDPDVVDAFLAREDEFLAIKQRLDDTQTTSLVPLNITEPGLRPGLPFVPVI